MVIREPKIRTNRLGTRYVVIHVGGERIVVTLPKEG